MKLREEIADRCPEAWFLPPEFDDCLMGYVERFGMGNVPLYDWGEVMKVLEKSGMSEEDAEEWYEYNILGAWMGEGTPAFAVLGSELED